MPKVIASDAFRIKNNLNLPQLQNSTLTLEVIILVTNLTFLRTPSIIIDTFITLI